MNLRSKLIRLAHQRPELRAEILPLLAKRATVDDSKMDPAVLADVKKAMDAMENMVAAMTQLARKLEQKHEHAEDVYQQQLKILGDDDKDLWRYQDLMRQYGYLFRMLNPNEEGSITRKIDNEAYELKRELTNAAKLLR